MTRIGIDCRFADTPCGLGRYVRELVTALAKLPSDYEFVLIVKNQAVDWLNDIPFKTVKIKAKHYSIGEQQALWLICKLKRLDGLFCPHFNVPWLAPIPYVVTIHDLILHSFPNQAHFFKRFAYKRLIKKATTDSKAIIAVSDFTKRDLIKHYPSAAHKISVITEGAGNAFYPRSSEELAEIRQEFDLVRPYFIYVGNDKEHKQVDVLVKAFRASGRSSHDLILVGCSNDFDHDAESSIKVLSGINDDQLAALYTGADALVTASTYEGFCLPIVEAQACGCPVIASNTSAIPEVANKNAQLIAPTEVAFTQAFKSWVPAKDRQVTKPTSWETIARETLAVFKRVF